MMKSSFARCLSVVLALIVCMTGLSGCYIVYGEREVLLNPTSSATTTSFAQDMPTDTTDAAGTPAASGTAGTGKTSATKATQQTAVNVEKKLSGKLEIQCFTNESKAQNEDYTALFEEFERVTGVEVTAHVGSQVNQRLSKRWIGGNPPDFAFLNGAGIPDVALEASGALYDCADVIMNGYVYGTNEKIWDVVNRDYFEIKNGKIYRPASGGSAYGVLYDAVYMKKLGLTMPTNYTELTAFAKQAVSKGEAAFTTYGMDGTYAGFAMVYPAIGAYGQDFFDDFMQGKKSAWSDARTKNVLQRWYDFCNTPGNMLTGTASFDHTTSQMKWLTHDAVLLLSANWVPWEMANAIPANFEMTYTASPLVLDTQNPTVIVTPGRYIVAKDAKNLENALAFLRFCYRKEQIVVSIKNLGGISIRTDLTAAEATASANSNINRIQQYFYSGKADFVIKTYDWGELNTETSNIILKLMSGSASVDEALNDLLSKTTK